jgi:hypothetical protein
LSERRRVPTPTNPANTPVTQEIIEAIELLLGAITIANANDQWAQINKAKAVLQRFKFDGIELDIDLGQNDTGP